MHNFLLSVYDISIWILIACIVSGFGWLIWRGLESLRKPMAELHRWFIELNTVGKFKVGGGFSAGIVAVFKSVSWLSEQRAGIALLNNLGEKLIANYKLAIMADLLVFAGGFFVLFIVLVLVYSRKKVLCKKEERKNKELETLLETYEIMNTCKNKVVAKYGVFLSNMEIVLINGTETMKTNLPYDYLFSYKKNTSELYGQYQSSVSDALTNICDAVTDNFEFRYGTKGFCTRIELLTSDEKNSEEILISFFCKNSKNNRRYVANGCTNYFVRSSDVLVTVLLEGKVGLFVNNEETGLDSAFKERDYCQGYMITAICGVKGGNGVGIIRVDHQDKRFKFDERADGRVMHNVVDFLYSIIVPYQQTKDRNDEISGLNQRKEREQVLKIGEVFTDNDKPSIKRKVRQSDSKHNDRRTSEKKE